MQYLALSNLLLQLKVLMHFLTTELIKIIVMQN